MESVWVLYVAIILMAVVLLAFAATTWLSSHQRSSELLHRAARRAESASHALSAAAIDLDRAGALAGLVNGTAGAVQSEAERVAGLVQQIEHDRWQAGIDRRVRDGL